MEGATIEEVGDRFEGDVLGDDPIGSALAAARAAIASVAETAAQGGTVQLSFGETPKEEYAMQLAADNLVHGWDLAVATGGDTRMDPHLVHAVADWFDDREEMYRGGGAIAARRRSPATRSTTSWPASAATRRGARTTGRCVRFNARLRRRRRRRRARAGHRRHRLRVHLARP